MEIRKATKKDISGMIKIDTFAEQLKGYTGLDELDLKKSVEKEAGRYYNRFISKNKKWVYVAEEDEKIIGFILFTIQKRERYYKIKKVGYIDLIVVDKNARRKGVAKLLMKKAYEEFKEKGILFLRLSVHTDNPSHEIWKKLGFKDYKVDMWREI
ncbi:MAG: GNAT family N-acetyltransferase [Candidatus Woesearchaeota archaeon]